MKYIKLRFKSVVFAVIMIIPGLSVAQVPHAFSTGNPIVASEMNDNFNNLDGRVTTNETDISSQDARITALESSGTTTPDFSGYPMPFSAIGAPKNVAVFEQDDGFGGTNYFVRSRYANNTEQVSIDGVLTIRPFIANYASVTVDSLGDIVGISNFIESPDTANYVNYNEESSTYDPAALPAFNKTVDVDGDTTRQLWGFCPSTGSVLTCLPEIVNSIDGSFVRRYSWSRVQTIGGPFTVNGMTFNDVRVESYTSFVRTRVRAKGIGEIWRLNSDGVTERSVIFYRVDGQTGGSLVGTPFEPGVGPLDGLFF